MRIFKKEFSELLTKGMSMGECIITKINSQYGEFIIHRKVAEGSFPYLGLFRLLEDAVKFVQTMEQPEPKYEYYLQRQEQLEEGWDRASFEVMGQLGWELCGIDSNIKDGNKKSMYIYKRQLHIQPSNGFNGNLIEEDIDEWTARKEDEMTRNKVPSRVLDFAFKNINDSTTQIEIHFGKNGLGLTNELTIIGEKIHELSKKGLVYIKDCFIDSIDDVYDLTLTLKPFKE